MKHRIGYNRLDRKTAHRKAMIRNMLTSLFEHERIRTTETKAKEVRRFAEKMITRAKIDTVHNRRLVASRIWDKSIVAKLFTDLGPRFIERPGGYTRIIKLGYRKGDAADMVIFELVGELSKKSSKTRAKKKKADEVVEPAAAPVVVKSKDSVEHDAIEEDAPAQEADEAAEDEAKETLKDPSEPQSVET